MEVVFLGTSCAIPTKTRNLPSIAILHNGNQYLFDTGEDIQRQFEKASLKFNSPLKIFISHMHGDHVIGLPGLLFHFSLLQRTKSIEIYGPKGIFAYLMLHKYVLGLKAPFLQNIFEYSDKQGELFKFNFQEAPDQIPKQISMANIENSIYSDEYLSIETYPVEHSVPTWGFRIIEKPRPGKFHPQKAEELGVPKGYLWGIIQKSEQGEKITIDGREIDPFKSGIMGPKKPGRIISYSADTRPCENLKIIAQNSDIFICEATYDDSLNEVAYEKKHMTAKQCAQISKEVNVKKLILTHISSRYSKLDQNEILLGDAKPIFPNTIVADDLMRISL